MATVEIWKRSVVVSAVFVILGAIYFSGVHASYTELVLTTPSIVASSLGVQMLLNGRTANSLTPQNDQKTILLVTDNPVVLNAMGGVPGPKQLQRPFRADRRGRVKTSERIRERDSSSPVGFGYARRGRPRLILAVIRGFVEIDGADRVVRAHQVGFRHAAASLLFPDVAESTASHQIPCLY
jgi:hypothetical protein